MLETLSLILNPLKPSEFHSDYYSKKPFHIGNQPNKFKNLFGWDSLNKVLNSSPVPHPTMKMVLEGRPILATDAESVIEKCKEGASLVIEEMHSFDTKVGELASNLTKEIGEPTRVNLYFSQPNQQGYNRHYDTHDVFILQIAGYKKWTVFDQTVQFPLFVQKFHDKQPPNIPLLDVTLEPGDVLYVPRGFWHEATAQIEPSLHLTLGIYARTGIDFLNWLIDELREDVDWRETFPLILKNEDQIKNDLSLNTIEHFQKLRSLISLKLNQEDLLNKYRKFCISQLKKIDPFNFSSQNPEHHFTEKTKFTRPNYQQVIVENNDGKVELIVWGKKINFSSAAEQLINYIFTSQTFTGKDALNAIPQLSWKDISVVLKILLEEDIIQINPEE